MFSVVRLGYQIVKGTIKLAWNIATFPMKLLPGNRKKKQMLENYENLMIQIAKTCELSENNVDEEWGRTIDKLEEKYDVVLDKNKALVETNEKLKRDLEIVYIKENDTLIEVVKDAKKHLAYHVEAARIEATFSDPELIDTIEEQESIYNGIIKVQVDKDELVKKEFYNHATNRIKKLQTGMDEVLKGAEPTYEAPERELNDSGRGKGGNDGSSKSSKQKKRLMERLFGVPSYEENGFKVKPTPTKGVAR